jgi:hypothetical protein
LTLAAKNKAKTKAKKQKITMLDGHQKRLPKPYKNISGSSWVHEKE